MKPAVIVVAVLAVIVGGLLLWGKHTQDENQRQVDELACAMRADAQHVSHWALVDGRCETS